MKKKIGNHNLLTTKTNKMKKINKTYKKKIYKIKKIQIKVVKTHHL